ncbi:putative MFS transporter [Xylogone sp. PMI_703]|nr:putative MFS transporter [Xylogone sp. PMI_703]
MRRMSYQPLRLEESIRDDHGELRQERITTKSYLWFAALCILDLTETIDATSVIVVLPAIAVGLHASTTLIFFLGVVFLLCSTIFQPIFHALSINFGRKAVLLVALAIFLLGSVVCGWAPNIYVLLAGRAVQGIGGAGCTTLPVVVVTDLVPLRQRATWIAILNLMAAVGSVSGPIIGGSLAEINWRWIFWLNIPLTVASFVGLSRFLHLEAPLPARSTIYKLSRLDYLGAVLFLSSSTAFLLPISLAGTIASWRSATIILPLILGFAGLILFIFQQQYLTLTRSDSSPILPLAIFSNYTAKICYINTFVHGTLLLLVLYYLPLYYEGVLGYSPLKVAIATLPEALTIAPSAVITGLIISRTGTYVAAIRLGWILATAGMGLLCVLSSTTPIHICILLNILPGVALGMLIPATSTAVQAATDPTVVGHAVSMFYMIRGCGQTIGVAIGSAIFRNRLTSILSLTSFAGKEEIAAGATVEALLRTLRGLKENGIDDRELINGVVKALRVVWGFGCALAGVTGIASYWIESYNLD